MRKLPGVAAILCFFFTLALISRARGSPAALQEKQEKNAPAQAEALKSATPGAERAAETYYSFSMGHYYAELYLATSRSEYARLAIEYLEKAYQLNPQSEAIGEELAEVYAKSQRIRDAVLKAQEILERDPDNLAARHLLARIYIHTLGDLNPSVAQRETANRAIEQYREILRLDPQDAEAAQWLARLYRLKNQHDKAEEVLRGLLQREPENGPALEQLTQLLLDQGRADEAIRLLKPIVDRAPQSEAAAPGLLDLLGNSYAQAQQYAKAEQAYRRAVTLDPNETGHRRGLAQALLAQQKYDAALEQYQHLVQLDPEEVGSYLRMAQIYRRMNKLDQAEETLLRAKQRAPGNLQVVYQEALVYEAQGRFEDGIRILSGAVAGLKGQPENGTEGQRTLAVLYEQLVRLYREVEKYPAALDTLQEMARLVPDEEKHAQELIIDTYRASKDIDRAIAEAEKARARYPEDRSFVATLAILRGEKGETEAAAQILRGMLHGTPEDRITYIELAQVYERGRRYADAEKAAQAAEKLSSQPTENEMVWFLLGAISERQKKYEQAEQYFQKALALNPRNSAVLNYYGYMLADLGIRLEEAVALVKRALAEEQNNGAYLDSLGWAYYKLNRLKEAEEYLRKAIERTAHDPTIRDHLGDIYSKTGRIEQAVAEWERALGEWQRVLPTEYETDRVGELEKKLEQSKHRLAQTAPGSGKPH